MNTFNRSKSLRDARDRQIARLNLDGYTDFEICRRLGVSLVAVEAALARPARELRPLW